MKHGAILGSRIWQVATLLAATLVLSGAAVYNGYPLVYPDTGDYVALADIGFRSIFYSLFIAPARLAGSLWPVVFLQSLIVAHLLALVLRVVFLIVSEAAFFVITVLLCVLTSLPWYTGFVMPDIFAAVLVLCFFLLAFCRQCLTQRERKYIAMPAVAAAAVHLSHIPLAAGLLFIALLARLALAKRREIPLPNVTAPALVVAAALLLILTRNYVTHREVTFSCGGYAFPLARLVADGQAVRYLRESCPQRKYALCDYIEELPDESSDFLWSSRSPFRKVGWIDGYRREGGEIVVRTTSRYPVSTLSSALRNTIRQIAAVRTGTGLTSWMNRPYPTDELRTFYPAEFKAYENSRQSRELLGFDALNHLHMTVVVLSAIYSCVAAVIFARRGQWLPLELLITIAGAVLINAFVAGALSVPNSRYGSRLIWLVPFFALASYREVLDLTRKQWK
jgi:hypothetical protein